MIGQSLPRKEDRRFVTGAGRYTDDIQLEGQAYAFFLRSPQAHALIRSIETGAARSMPGVLAVLTVDDYLAAGFGRYSHRANPPNALSPSEQQFQHPLNGYMFMQGQLPLAHGKVRHVGEAVALVVAQTHQQARDAAEAIEVDYEVLPAVVQADAAMQPDAPQLWDEAQGNLCFEERFGDQEAVQAAFCNAHHVVRREFRHSRVVNCQMEPRAALGSYDPGSGTYTLISGCQGVLRLRAGLAEALGTPAEKIRVTCPDVGGGFGPRTWLYVEQLAVVWAARHVGRAVKWTGDRSEAFVSDYQGRDAIIRAAIAFSGDGRILAIDHQWIGNVGAHTVSFTPMANGTRILSTVYDIPLTAVHVSGVMTNTVPTAPYRGAGRPEATHVMERMLDIAARELGVDRIDIRRRNLIGQAQLPYRNPMGLTYDSGDFQGNMDRALELADWNGFSSRREHARKAGRLAGIGMANYIEAPVGMGSERVEVTVLPEGLIDVIAGTQSTGQGHETTFAQVVSQLLGVPLGAVRLRTGDTDFVKIGGGSHSNRSMRLGGTLLVRACEDIVNSGRPVAAMLLDTEQPEFAQGRYWDRARKQAVDLFDVARHAAAGGLTPCTDGRAWCATAEIHTRIPAHPTGAVVCELEIDPDTGCVRIVNYTSIDDVGRPINPMIVEGQVHGALAQGLGQAFSEAYYVDSATGQVLSGSYMDYGVPRAGAVPPLRIEFTEDPTAGNPLRVKGGGESGITPATAAVFNALADAVRELTTQEPPMPATPAAVWKLIQDARDRQT